MTEQTDRVPSDLYLSDLTQYETTAHASEQFIPARDLSEHDRADIEHAIDYQLLALRQNLANEGKMLRYGIRALSFSLIYAPVLTPQQAKDAELTDFSRTLQQEQREYLPELTGKHASFVTYSDYTQVSKYLLFMEPTYAMPHDTDENNQVIVNHFLQSLHKKTWMNVLDAAAGLMYTNPDNPRILEKYGINLEPLWPDIARYFEQQVFPHDFGYWNFQAMESMQLLFPGRIQKLRGYENAVQDLKDRLRAADKDNRGEQFIADLKAYAAYHLTVLTSGGLQIATEGIEILPRNSSLDIQNIPETPVEYT